MKLFEKLEVLVDELTSLVREERARRNNLGWERFPGITWRSPDFYGPHGTEFRVGDNTGGGK